MKRSDLLPLDLAVLESMNGGPEVSWGAAVTSSLEFLSDHGLCTRGPSYQITDKGREAFATCAWTSFQVLPASMWLAS